MKENYFEEAFRAFDELNEDMFNINTNDGLEKAREFADDTVDVNETEIIIDPLAETEEELEETYVGKAILQCNVCRSMIYKKPEEVIIDETVGLANVEEECPVCQSQDGFKVIGQIEEFCDNEECDKTEDEVEDNVEDKVEETEEIKDEEETELTESKKLNEEVSDEAYEVAEYINSKADGKEFIEYEEFNGLFNDAVRNLGVTREIYQDNDFESDVRGILANNGWETVFEGEDEGGLRLVESTTRDKIDADKDNRIEKARKNLKRVKDDADSDRDYKLKRKGLKESRKLNEGFRGCKEVEMIWHGAYSDPELYYKDEDGNEYYANYYDVEDSMWDYYKGEAEYAKTRDDDYAKEINSKYDWSSLAGEDDTDFDKFIVDHEDSVIGDVIEFSEYNNYNHSKDVKESCSAKKSKKSLKESDKPAATSIEDAQKWVDYDMKKYGKISERTNRLVKKAGFQILKDDHGDYEVAAGKFESCNEDFNKVDIETDREKMSMTADENGKVTVTTEPKTENKEEDEVIAPITDETKREFQEVEIDEFDENEFDNLGEGYLKRVYENVKSFKTTNGSIKGNNIKLEGIIEFKSGKKAKTNFVFEALTATKTGKLKFIGENKQFAKGKKSFTLTGKLEGKKLVCEALQYNYTAKDNNGNSKKLYGRVCR